ncbi:MAG: hypothetical protein IT366_09320 [Candidatus Hydrogenedentes bacterium]|nr:hypothetical protein [Candidatus Hydrogenedentota bacterium]
MKTHYVLIDFENVQPKHLDRLRGGAVKVLVFVGSQQTKVPIEMASALQTLGSGVEYIRLEKSGRNALDFSMAYYLGALSQQDAAAHFHLISKDTGFDPLIQHLTGKKVAVKRHSAIADMGPIRHSQAQDEKNWTERIVNSLIRRKEAKPSTLKTLRSSLLAEFKQELAEQELDDKLNALQKSGHIKIDGKKVSYNLPVKV